MSKQSIRTQTMLSIGQVAERLRVSTKTVRRWIDRDAIHVHRLARVIRISEEDLQSFLNGCRD